MELGRARYSFGEGNGNPLLYSSLENPVDRGALWAAVMGSQAVTLKRLKRLSSSRYSFGKGKCNPLLYSSLKNPVDRGDWWAAVMGSQAVTHD